MLTPNGVDGKTKVLRDTVNRQDRTVLFVESASHPDKLVALNHYYHDKKPLSKRKFFRLYKVVWTINVGDGHTVDYSLLEWEEVIVKRHCRQAFSDMIDTLEAAQEFLY